MASERLLAEWFWLDRYQISDAALLPLEPRGLHREMLSQAWLRGARLPNDPDQIRRRCRVTPAEWDRCWPYVSPFWRVDADALVNDDQLETYRDSLAAVAAAKTRSLRAQAGAQARREALAQARQLELEEERRLELERQREEPLKKNYQKLELEQELGSETTPPSPPAGGTLAVFAYWKATLGHPDAKLTPKRSRLLGERLRDGYTPEQLRRAIDGCRASEWHMGANDRGEVYDDLSLIMRDGDHVERFIALADRPHAPPGSESGGGKPGGGMVAAIRRGMERARRAHEQAEQAQLRDVRERDGEAGDRPRPIDGER